MKTQVATTIGVGMLVLVATAAAAQTPAPNRGVSDRQQRYQIGTMERVLEGAVEHGAAVTRDRLRAYVPADMLLSENARVRGFKLDGYGMFFDVAVPSLEGTVPWTFRALDQNNLGLDTALRTLRSFIQSSSPNDADVQQAFRRLELQVAPVSAALTVADPRDAPAGVDAQQPQPSAQTADPGVTAAITQPDPILENPEEAYRIEIRDALMDAMLEHSRGLAIAPDEWLTIAARRNEERPRLSPVDTDSRTVIIKVRGADLNAFLGGQISRDEARARMEVRVF
jgi:hypothetical protein